jgi:hypothetical protein
MANFSNSFTGKGTYTPLPSGQELQRSQEKMSDLILSAEKLKQDTYRRNAEEFSKASDVDPVFVLSDSARKTQAELLNKFNTYWGKIYKERGGNLTEQDKTSMARDKDYLMMEQGNMKATMDRFIQDRETISKDIKGQYAVDEWKPYAQEYYTTGKYNVDSLPIKAGDFKTYLRERSQKNRNEAGFDVLPAEQGYDERVTRNVLKGKEGEEIKSAFLEAPESEIKSFFNDWTDWKKANPEEANKILDVNGDGIVSKNEANIGITRDESNPIMKWAMNNPQYQEAVVTYQRTGTRIPRVSGNSATNFLFGFKKSGYVPEKAQRAEPAPGITVERFHPFNKSDAFNLTMKTQASIKKVKQGAFSQGIAPTSTMSVTPLGYDEDADEYYLRVNEDYANEGLGGVIEAGKGDIIAVKRDDMSNQKIANDTEVLDDNGNVVKIGNIKRTTPSAPIVQKPTTSGVNWATPKPKK